MQALMSSIYLVLAITVGKQRLVARNGWEGKLLIQVVPWWSTRSTCALLWYLTCASVVCQILMARYFTEVNEVEVNAEYFTDDEFHQNDMGCASVQLGNVPPTHHTPFLLLPTIRYLRKTSSYICVAIHIYLCCGNYTYVCLLYVYMFNFIDKATHICVYCS